MSTPATFVSGTPAPPTATSEVRPPAPRADDLSGFEFLLVSAKGYTPVAGVPIRLWFGSFNTSLSLGEPNSIGFDATCNLHQGTYRRCGDRLCVEGFGKTEVGCGREQEEQDDFLSDFLRAQPKLLRSGDKLTLVGSSATLEFLDREVADPDRPLTGRTWTVNSFVDRLGEASMRLTADPTVEFKDDGSFRVVCSCATAQGEYLVHGETLSLSQVSRTNGACATENDEKACQRVVAVIRDGRVSFAIDAARLTLARGDLALRASTE